MQLGLRTCFYLGIVGLLQGFGLYLLNQTDFSPPIYTFIFSFLLLSGLFIQLAWPSFSTGQLVFSSLILSLLFSAIFGWRFGVDDDSFYLQYFVPFILLIASVYIVNTFHQVYHHNGQFTFPYSNLFIFAWNTIFLIGIALFFMVLCYGLIKLWGYLFNFLGIPYFYQIFNSKLFIYLSLPFFFGFGIGLVNQFHGVITALRKIVTAVFSILLPIIAFIGVTFILTYLGKIIYSYFSYPFLTFIAIQSFSDNFYINMIIMIIAVILFLNAAFQNGQPIIKYPRWLKHFISFFILISPIFCVLAFYNIIISLMQQTNRSLAGFAGYGTLLFLSILSLYIIAYALFSFTRSRGWMGFLPIINKSLAWCIVFIAIFINSPLLDPVTMIQNHQISQLKRGNFEGSASMYLVHADLKGINLRGVRLTGVNLSYADLSNADLSHADLSYAKLDHANLTHTQLKNANLSGASLDFTNVTNADFTQAKLFFSHMKNIMGLTQKQLNSALCTPKTYSDSNLPDGLRLKICK